jgi:hypothetical protein
MAGIDLALDPKQWQAAGQHEPPKQSRTEHDPCHRLAASGYELPSTGREQPSRDRLGFGRSECDLASRVVPLGVGRSECDLAGRVVLD